LALVALTFSQTIVSNALPRISSVFHALDNITWIPTAFLLTQAPSLLVFGQLSTLFSLKWVFLIAVVLFEIGSLLSAVATSIGFLIGARAFQGIGAAGIFIGSMARLPCSLTHPGLQLTPSQSMTAEIIALRDRPKFFGLFGAIFAISGILGPLIGGAFVDHVSWRWCFYINLPLAVPTLCLVSYVATRILTRLRKLDWIGCILSLGCTCSLVLALQWGGAQKPWGSADVIATLCVAAATALLFVAWEYYRGETALVPLKLFKNRSQVGASLGALFNRMGFFVAIFELPLYFQAVKGHSPTKSGLDLMPITIALVITSAVVGGITSKTGRYWHFLILGPTIGAVGFGLIFTLDEYSNWGKIIGYQILIGVGIGTTMQTTMIAIQADTEKHLIPQRSGILTYSQFMGGMISLAIAGHATAFL
ncbi:MFS general substrate transporter, partial [Auricularia subglabra TFB-10046 SS5]